MKRKTNSRLVGIEQAVPRFAVGHPRTSDRYGRLLYYVYTRDGDSIDEILVSEGLAIAWTRDGQHRDLLVGLEREATRDLKTCFPKLNKPSAR